MGQALVLEIVDHRGRLRHRHRLGDSAVTLGRGYQNDLIVDDPYVDPRHLKIESTEAGDWVVTDLGSRNGTWESRFQLRVTSALLQPGQQLTLGRTTIRVLALDHAVAPALADPARQLGWVHRLSDWSVALPVLLVSMAAAAATKVLGTTTDPSFVDWASPAIGVVLAGSLWALGWATANRLVAAQFQFVAHLSWAMAIGLGFLLTEVGVEWVDFLLPGTDWSALTLIAYGGLFTLLLVGHLQLITEWSTGKLWRRAIAVTAISVTIIGIVTQSASFGDRRRSSLETVPLKPLSARLVPSTSLDQFFGSVTALEKEVDDLAGDAKTTNTAPTPIIAPPKDSAQTR